MTPRWRARAELISTRPSGRAREKINCRTRARAKVTPIAMLLVPAIPAAALLAPRRGRTIKREFLSVKHWGPVRLTLLMRWSYAEALYKDGSGSLGELREAVTTLEEIERVEQRVLGGAHPTTLGVEDELRDARAAPRARETSP